MTDLRDRFAPAPPEQLAGWTTFFSTENKLKLFPHLVGLQLEDVRRDYSRMRLPFRPELNQPGGMVHGGAIATLIDTVVVPAIASAYDQVPAMLTISMTIDYLGALQQQDAIAEGWVEKRGKRTVFCRAEVRSAGGELVTRASLVYSVRP